VTKNHILIKSIALGVLLMLSPIAKATGGVDQVLVAYFKKLHMGASPKCSIDDIAKTRILAELEPKCLIRSTVEGQLFISGVKPECTEVSVKASVDAQVNALCVNTAQQADQAKVVQQQQAAAEAAKKAAANQASGGGSGGAASALQQASQGLALWSDITSRDAKREKADKEKEERSGNGRSESGSSTAAGSSSNGGKIKELSPVGTSSIHGNSMGSVNQAIGNANVKIREHNAAIDAQKAADVAYDNCDKIKDVDCSGLKIAKDEADKKVETLKEQTVAEGKKIADEQRDPIGSAGKDALDEGAAEGEDPELTKRHAQSRAEDESIGGQIKAISESVKAAIAAMPAEATASCASQMGTNPECATVQPAITCLETNMKQLEVQKVQLQKDKEACSNTSAQAEKMCSMVRSKKAKDVQKLMSIGATVLSKVTAASDACGTTSDISKIAQGGMLLAQGTCTAMKVRCDLSCNSAKKTLLTMERTAGALKACKASVATTAPNAVAQVETGTTQFQTKIKEELSEGKSVPSAITQCKNHKTDIALMGLSALGFLSAFQDAQECKKQLASGNGDGGKTSSSLAGPNMTTAEYCSMSNNATSITCKCTANPNADGCMGSLAKSGVNIGKIGNNGGASAFASAAQNGLGSLNSMSKSPGEELPPGTNLSEAAREALGINGDAVVDSIGGAAAVGSGSSAEAAKKSKDKEEKDKPKFGFFSSLGNMLSGGKKPDQAANATIRKYEQDQAIKRKLASDQVRAEISTASGKSNFDKIRSRYQQNAASFEQ